LSHDGDPIRIDAFDFAYILALIRREVRRPPNEIKEPVGMKALRRVGVSIFVVLGLVLAPTVTQAGAAAFTPTPGEYFIDTSTLELTGPGTAISGVNEGGVAVFAFDSITIPAGVEIFAEGSRPFELRSAGAFTLAGLLEASGFDATAFVVGPNPGGPGGGAGSAGGFEAGEGPGGGGATSNNEGGGGGGGFGGLGAAGGPPGGGASGVAYGDLNVTFQGGSGGAGGSTSSPTGGGGGGGAVKLSASTLTISGSGEVLADGGDGATGGFGASGGGSGGGILLHAATIDVTGILSAEGGDGGAGGCCGDGGGGGGGRIAYQYGTLLNSGKASVAGGESGVGGAFGHGGLSPQVTGAPGVITQGPSATTSPATAISSSGATLNGVINPRGVATTYHFQLGTSTAYGTIIPVPAGAVGSDSSNHQLSQAVSGLIPNTTYHYRIVASAFGFDLPGADVTFTTPPLCDGLKISQGRVKVKNGKAPIQLSSSQACKGELALFMKAPPKKGKGKKGKGKAKGSAKKKGRKSILIGSASFSLDAGQTTTIKVSLSAAALKRLSLGKALPATAKATPTPSAGAIGKITQANVSLKLAKKGKGPKKHH
jgi:hypothetical protein